MGMKPLYKAKEWLEQNANHVGFLNYLQDAKSSSNAQYRMLHNIATALLNKRVLSCDIGLPLARPSIPFVKWMILVVNLFCTWLTARCFDEVLELINL